uniref:ATP synthase complex subunit 8 n=1 Tax=Trichoprosopon pallidiventer TaxID=2007230 RepID=A0A5B9H7K6_9DIPT|nr:ATP synthase F0 subunit 8 [Trichoprosopon pallidiventer]QEE94427.1 ATP synthase F0 subunit 8 [Trichoprosopon pallidiventer]
MPQMAPISWLTLFIIFSFTLILFNMKIFYCNIPMMPKLTQFSTLSKSQLNWKW